MGQATLHKMRKKARTQERSRERRRRGMKKRRRKKMRPNKGLGFRVSRKLGYIRA